MNKILTFILYSGVLIIITLKAESQMLKYPAAIKIETVNNFYGTAITDNYRWLENSKDQKVRTWTEEQEKFARSVLDKLPQRAWLIKRLNQLTRYDDESVPRQVLYGTGLFYWSKKKNDEKWVYNYKENEGAKGVELLNPNDWDKTETLNQASPSRDGKYLAFGKAKNGNENPVIQIMETASKKILPDDLLGWRQNVTSWLPDDSGFFYSAFPLKGEVPAGEEYFWQAVYYHELGTSKSEDKKVFFHEKVKEYYHSAEITEDGKYILFYRSMFNKNEVYFKNIGSMGSPEPIIKGFDANYEINEIAGKFFIQTDKDAPMGKVFVTDADKPGIENWKVFIPETNDNLLHIKFIGGRIYAEYSHNAYTLIRIYSPDGKYLCDLPLPAIGSADVSGYWSKPDVWVNFSSFNYPRSTFKYNFNGNDLKLYHKIPVDISVSNYITEQVRYHSKDGTEVTMFLVYNKNIKIDGNNPVFLTGYGGFNIPMSPYFSELYVCWLEAGGMIAIPNLRGGGEYGKKWHEAGMREKKQNVFDDFIAAAQWLINNKYTNPKRLAIAGGSNGGLLTGAVTVQRPDLFKAVYCGVPLLDMIRYQKFGYADVWAEEYGSSDDPEQFKYLIKYSPYHNVKDGVKYPAVLLTGSEDDARVDPMHARKMAARMQEASTGSGPILLLIRKASGHFGGTTLSTVIEQNADICSFLMEEIGMELSPANVNRE